MELSQAQIESYQEQGFLVVEGLLSDEDVEAIRSDAVKLCRGEYKSENLHPVPNAESDTAALSRYLCIHQPHHISPVMREYLAHPAVSRALARLVAPDVKCMQSMLFIKPPRFPGQAWHQDEVYIPTRDRSLTGAWYALDDVTVENGCMWVLPGSHRNGYLYPQRLHGRPEEFDSARESYGFDDRKEIPVACPAGAVVFFNGYLLHRSRKNRSDRFRRVLVNHYMNAYSLLPWHRPPEDGRMALADYRGIMMVAGDDPYAWKGTVEGGDAHVRTFDPAALQTE
ncbi:MAG: phytanoyl-CoA dioxygenase family protein [Gemmatimonadetes bacterium]|nr:phytanoyl-CoA dioxygenase family protein [Gemmatimonadota bacterium]MDE3258419.1 phytanoyl-CoA dioxygenase family protein [Gemmatimonadota bacterium]